MRLHCLPAWSQAERLKAPTGRWSTIAGIAPPSDCLRASPGPHYNFRTTITLSEPYTYPRPSPRLSVYETPEALYAPVYTDVPYVMPLYRAQLLPGYYGSSYTYDDQGPYYGGPYVPYWDRLPYACGVYGYC